jgi:hypothetical protein
LKNDLFRPTPLESRRRWRDFHPLTLPASLSFDARQAVEILPGRAAPHRIPFRAMARGCNLDSAFCGEHVVLDSVHND